MFEGRKKNAENALLLVYIFTFIFSYEKRIEKENLIHTILYLKSWRFGCVIDNIAHIRRKATVYALIVGANCWGEFFRYSSFCSSDFFFVVVFLQVS